MKLSHILQEASPANTVLNTLKRSLGGVVMKIDPRVTSHHKTEIEIGGNDGLSVIEKILKKSNITKEIEQTIERLGVDEEDWDEWETQWLHELGKYEKLVLNHIVANLPKGWRIVNYLFSTERDPLDPYFKITISADSDRRSRTTSNWFYHITLASNVESIKRTGLVPMSSNKNPIVGTYQNKIFLMRPRGLSVDHVQDIARMLQSEITADHLGHSASLEDEKEIALLKVSVPVDVTKRLDRTAGNVNGVYVQQHIPAENIKVHYIGSINDIRL